MRKLNDWVYDYAELMQELGGEIAKIDTTSKHPGITVNGVDTRKLIQYLNAQGDFKLLPVGIGGSLFEDYLMMTLNIHNSDVRLYISGAGKTNAVVRVNIDWLDEDWKMRQKSNVKVCNRRN